MTSTLPPLVQAFSGAIGSVAANASAYPLDLVCTRLQTSHQKERRGILSAISTLRQIIKKGGIIGLYDGLETDTAATLVSGFFYFYAYSFLRDKVFNRHSGLHHSITKPSSATLTALEEIAIGFIAGVASRAISTPLSLVTVRLQSDNQHSSDLGPHDVEKGRIEDNREGRTSSKSIKSVVKRIYAEGGLRGFWRGFEITTLLCLNPSLTLFLYQAFRRLFLRGRDREQPSPRQAFVGAAISNVIAVAILYPLILAKTRLQSQSHDEPREDPNTLSSSSPNSNSSSNSNSNSNPDLRSNPSIISKPSSKSSSISMFTIWHDAYTQSGLWGLYQGLEAQLVKGFVSQGLAMMVKQRIEQLVIAVYLSYIHATNRRRVSR